MPQTTVLPAAKRNHDDSLGRCRKLADPKLPAVSHAQKPYRSFESPRMIVDKVATLVDKISQRISSDTDGTILPTPRSPPVMGRLSRAIEVGTKFKDVTIPALRSTAREEANMSRGLTTPWRAEAVQPGSKAAAAESLQIDEVPCIYSFLRKQFADVNLHNRRAVTESDLISFVRSRARHMGHVPADFEDLLRESGRRCFQQAAVRKEGLGSLWLASGVFTFSAHAAAEQDVAMSGIFTLVYTALACCGYVVNWSHRRFAVPACCTVSFEDEQKQAFQRWETHWKNKASHLELLRSQMEDFGVTQEYRDASSTQRVLFDAALDSMRYVVATYGICFDTLLEYAAGMLCFSCQPHWHHQLLLDDSRVLLLRIEESSNNELWDHCSPLSSAAKELDHRIQDSMLAKRLTSSYIDFRMFDDRIRLSQYMESVGRIIMRGPNEHALKKTSDLSGSPSKVAALRLLSDPHPKHQTIQNQSSSMQGQSRFISPVEDGRKSGFVFHVFPRDPLPGSGGRRPFILEGCLLLLLQVV
ncbi:DESI1 [Symbiodinium necroappetens]|uniref:DESI1 protein n=1 Tax=Symbiodinium necroappetens TaxID=1628268 RepID=A0A812YGE2_9DINO|nr:DESI1 [Symbiodinium necroappetens]